MINTHRTKKFKLRPHNHICKQCDRNNGVWLHIPDKPGCDSGIDMLCNEHNPEFVKDNRKPNRWGVATTSKISITIRITEEASNGLAKQAFKAGYVKKYPAGRYPGIGAYIEYLASSRVFYDDRPERMRRMDNQPIFQNRKYWIPEGEIRRYNMIAVSELCLESLLSIAEEHGICNLKRRNGPIERINVIGLVLEAIGREWLRPL